uniref:Uncharacterized protein n=1 Tax=Nicotiana tabacum TaxID=4097 RepID=A0A1S4DC31_TOBAC|nr:uncharacterized protein LOC104114764 [Nicotiana tomentosiformis]XP_016510956.1 PREDICTED: uncharacterized protein LOC107828198 [Nicotiana tabacum]
MTKLLASFFYVVLFVSIASGERFVPVIHEEGLCTVDIGVNICAPFDHEERCMEPCIQATSARVTVATCEVREDLSTFCQCIIVCHAKHIVNQEKNLKIAASPAPY